MGVTSPVFDVQRFSVHDGPGIRTTVFLRGCPLRCAWCQNPEGQACLEAEADPRWADEVLAEVCADRGFYEASGGGLTLSGGEPLLDVGRARVLLKRARAAGLHTCVQTCGAVKPADLKAVLPWVDLFHFDLKLMDDAKHRAWTGAGTSRIHQNARLLVQLDAPVQFRMPVIPGVNDDTEHLGRVAAFLEGLGVRELRLVPYHRHYLDKYAALGRAAPLAALQAADGERLGRVTASLVALGIDVLRDG